MFGAFLGALGPIGWVAGAAITVAGIAAASSSSGSSRHTNEEEVRSEYKDDKIKELQADIDDYIQREIDMTQKNFNTKIALEYNSSIFNSKSFMLPEENDIKISIISKDHTLDNQIKLLENDISSIKETINILVELKYSSSPLKI